jgi:hypothetical protein
MPDTAHDLVRRIRKVEALHADQPLPATEATLARLRAQADANPAARALLAETPLPRPLHAEAWIPLLVWATASLRVDPAMWGLEGGDPEQRARAWGAAHRAEAWLSSLPSPLQEPGVDWLLTALCVVVQRAPAGIRPRKVRNAPPPSRDDVLRMRLLDRHIRRTGGEMAVLFSILEEDVGATAHLADGRSGPEPRSKKPFDDDGDVWEGNPQRPRRSR